MATPEDIAQQQKLLAIHRRNLQHYLGQQARLGPAQTPIGTLNGIDEERANIRRLKGILRGWQVAVDDQVDDEAPPPAEQASQRTSSQIDARDSQGFINSASGPISQNYGAGTVIHIHGGDFRGSNVPIGNTVGGDLSQTGAAMSTFDQRGWNVQGNVYNIAGDLNMGANPGKDEFLAGLRQLRDELAKVKDLPADEMADLKTNINDAIGAAERPQPNKSRIVKKLAEMREIADGLAGSSAAPALGKLIGQTLAAAQGLAL